jgi:acyl-CoA thioester hydrolase
MIFGFETTILPDWIDYNGHMRDSYFGLVFSLAVDALQDEIGFDESYRQRTGCTIYLLEDHKYYLREVKQGARVRVDTRVLGCDAKRFHLNMQMFDADRLVAVCELMEIHVKQQPQPHAEPMPQEILSKLERAVVLIQDNPELQHRSREIALLESREL